MGGMALDRVLISVDVGTQGTKAAVYSADLRLIATEFEASKLIQSAPGVVWQEADDLYGSVVRTIRALMDRGIAAPEQVLAVGIDSQMAGIMGISEDGEASTYYDSWLDTRCAKYMEQMRNRAGQRVTEITGGPVTYTHGPKILWWKGEQPEAYRRTAKFVLPHGYVAGKLCGLRADEAVFDHTCLQYSGFGDNLKRQWSQELLQEFQVDPRKMARIAPPHEVLGGVCGEAARALGLLVGTPVVAGPGDTAASILGAGLFEQGRLLDCAGTASVLCSVVDEYVPDVEYETLTMMRSPEEDRWYPLAYINGGGLCIRWFRDNFTGAPPLHYDQLDDLARRVPPGSEGITFNPHFGGRVLPNNPALKGSFTGLDWKHGAGHLYRAILEGIAYEYAYYLKVLRALYPESAFDQMTCIGGGSASELFLSIKADVMGVSAIPSITGDASLVGTAAVAGRGVGLFDEYRGPIKKTVEERQLILADAKNHAIYRPLRDQYLWTLDAISSL